MESRYKTHVRDRYSDRVDLLTDAARAVRQTLESPGWALIEELVAAEVADIERRSAFHPDRVIPKAVYAARHGYRTGLTASSDAADTLCRLADEAERRFDQAKRAPAEGRR